jgi:hypothetical protein
MSLECETTTIVIFLAELVWSKINRKIFIVNLTPLNRKHKNNELDFQHFADVDNFAVFSNFSSAVSEKPNVRKVSFFLNM